MRATVWWAPVAAWQDSLAVILSEEERTRASLFLHIEDHKSFVLAHALARHTLSHFADVHPADWQFKEGEFGKPAQSNDPGLEFSLSHTRGLVACAVARNHSVGVDVEMLTHITDCAALARTVLSALEFQAWQELPEEARQRRLLEYWTLKEAYVKARGLGLSLPPNSFSITDELERWRFHRQQLEDKYLLAAAVKADPGQCVEFEIQEALGLLNQGP